MHFKYHLKPIMYEELLDEQKKLGSVKMFHCGMPDGSSEMKLFDVEFWKEGRNLKTGDIKKISTTGLSFSHGKITKNVTKITFHSPDEESLEDLKNNSSGRSNTYYSSANTSSPRETISISYGVSRAVYDPETNGTKVEKANVAYTQGAEPYLEMFKGVETLSVSARIYGEGYKHTRPYVVGSTNKGSPTKKYHTSHGEFTLFDNGSYIINEHVSPRHECGQYNGEFVDYLKRCGVTVNSVEDL